MGRLLLIVPGAFVFVFGLDLGETPIFGRVLAGGVLAWVLYQLGRELGSWALSRPWFPWARVSK